MSIRLALSTLIFTGCVIEDADNVAPKAGDGIVVGDDQSISLDTTRVLTPPPSCEIGQLLSRTASGWACVAAPESISVNALATADLTVCTDGQVVKRAGGDWACSEDIDTDEDTLAATTCAPNQVLKWAAVDGWICADDAAGGTGQSLESLACTDRQIARFDDAQAPGNKWICVDPFGAADAVAAVQNADLALGAGSTIGGAAIASATDLAAHANDPAAHGETLASLGSSCGAGQVPTFNAGSWACSDPSTGPWTLAANDVYLNGGAEVGIGTTAPGTTLDVVGGFSLNKLGNASGLNQTVADSESLHVFVGDDATFISEQDETTGVFGGFDFIMDADDALSPRFVVRTKDGVTISQPLFYIGAGGGVGIGTITPDRLLSVNGGASKMGGGSWDSFSDARLKHIDGDYDEGLDAVMKLRPIRYRYKADNALEIHDQREHIGFVAQEVEKVLPDAVTVGQSGYRMVNNDPIILAMLNAIQEQQHAISSQQEENDRLRDRIARLESVVAKLAQSR
jgi:hypothetical protein